MARLWTAQEDELLVAVRDRLGEKLTSCPQYPEVVGDRKLIRFIRGHNHDINKVCEMVEKFLAWRIANGVNDIRQDIVDNQLDHPAKFPSGERILELNPMMVINTDATDKDGSYVSAEGVIPPCMWEGGITPKEYVRFRIYCLEYIMMCLENRADEREKEAQAAMEARAVDSDDSDAEEFDTRPYGVIEKLTVLRNVANISLADFTGANRETAQQLMAIASDNYPELLKKYYVVNAPWVFTGIFSVLKVFLAQKTIDKVVVLGSSYLSTVNELVPQSAIPEFLGGNIALSELNTAGDLSCTAAASATVFTAISAAATAAATPATAAATAAGDDAAPVAIESSDQ